MPWLSAPAGAPGGGPVEEGTEAALSLAGEGLPGKLGIAKPSAQGAQLGLGAAVVAQGRPAAHRQGQRQGPGLDLMEDQRAAGLCSEAEDHWGCGS